MSIRTAAPARTGDHRPAVPSRPVVATTIPTEFQSASPGVRCASFLLDLAAMMSPALPLSVAGAVLGVAEVVYLVVPVAFVAVWLWMQIWQGLSGNTFGKAMLGLRLVRADNPAPPGVPATLLRSMILIGTLGLAAVPMVLRPDDPTGLHDRVSGLIVLDVTVGANPLGAQQQTTLRRSPERGLNRVQSPIPVAAPRQG
ncbi:RDD family protein [Mycolicibacterium confluentis]|uniref:RDD domain-containing protein n=1 Tax=Mycolicibacterium confluentis TaxID=28047 RepID=A0A7I7Y482_9MYCO|nr:RDD family protein [Mycolicibacterium confluentis]BBZ35913.1 hypothetical protein MCNF_45180 [Mycolicibacterium confluentis]